MVESTYTTVARAATAELEVKRSRFRCDVARVDTDRGARHFIVDIRRQFRDATHHCTAFVLGPTAQIQRSNDDGEPSGTAGMPMLSVLTGRGLSDVVAVVTRYYGGTQLGAGGLVRAYGDAVSAALDAADVRQRAMHRLIEITVPAADVGRLDNQLRSIVQVRDISYGELATLTIAVPVVEVAGFHDKLAAFTGGAAGAVELNDEWADCL